MRAYTLASQEGAHRPVLYQHLGCLRASDFAMIQASPAHLIAYELSDNRQRVPCLEIHLYKHIILNYNDCNDVEFSFE
jgi:hypothetical protein